MSIVFRAIAISSATPKPKHAQVPAPGTTSPGARRAKPTRAAAGFSLRRRG